MTSSPYGSPYPYPYPHYRPGPGPGGAEVERVENGWIVTTVVKIDPDEGASNQPDEKVDEEVDEEVDGDAVRVERTAGGELGYCGKIMYLPGLEDEIARNWGGGTYRVTGFLDGEDRSGSIVVPGEPKPISDPDVLDYFPGLHPVRRCLVFQFDQKDEMLAYLSESLVGGPGRGE